MSDRQFKFLGNTMENISIKYGIFLITWSAFISWASQSESFTSWIPAIIGFQIFLFGWLSRVMPKKQKIFMHIAVVFGLLALLGGLDIIRSVGTELGPFSNIYVGASKLILLLTGGAFCFLCVKSFKFARLNKNSRTSAE